MIKNTKIKIAVSVSVLLLVLLFAALNIYSYLTELTEIGYVSVFYTNFLAGIFTGLFLFFLCFIFTFIWGIILKKNLSKTILAETLFDKKWLIPLVSTAGGIAYSVFFTKNLSQNVLLALNSVSSGKTDPLFGKDISYYMFTRPVLVQLRNNISFLFILLLLISAGLYIFYFFKENGSFNLQDFLKNKGIITHLSLNLAVIFLIKVVGFRFDMEDILFEQGERVGGGYTSVNVWLNFYRIIPFILLAVIIAALFFLYKSKYKLFIASVAVYPLCFVIASVVALSVQQLYVNPNEGSKESKFISYNIEATRDAYNLSDISEETYVVSENLTAEDLNNNREITDNIRITDHNSTLIAYNQLQGIRNFYQFIDADIVPYTENGQRKAAFISARELSQTGDLDDASYVNKRMKYTHGYGIVKSPINRVSKEGQPDFLIKDIPLVYNNTTIKVSQPRIYFGEAREEYVVVNTKQSELDFDETSTDNINYQGHSGIKLNMFNRLVYAVKYRDINLLTSSYITDESKLLTNHNVVNRIRKAAPFLAVDDDIHISIDSDGSLKWIADCYTYSSYYPYSQYTDNINYVRNSVKAVVDAYDGIVTFYVIDETDPVIQTYNKIYPEVFTKEPMSEKLKEQIKYPEWLFSVQADIYTKYHITDPATFYAGSDVWAKAREKFGENADIKNVNPYYNIMTLSGDTPEFIIMMPYTLKNKDNNLVGWLAARTDGENYGKFVSYSFPQGKHEYGTMLIENKIDNDPDISREITLWSQGGSSVMRGNMLVIPIKNSLIYVEPLYITSQNEASLPEVKRIIVSYGDRIVMESSLDEAFSKLFGTSASVTPDDNSPVTPDSPPDNSGVLEEIRTEYRKLQSAASTGDWETFGKSMTRIEELLR